VKHTDEPMSSDQEREASPTRKGDLAEYYAVTWLWDNGYEVFKNAGGSGSVDMIAVDKKGEITLIDVKTAVRDKRRPGPGTSRNGRTAKQVALGVKILLFIPDTRKLRFVEHKE